VINAGFLFDRAFVPLGDYQFRSDLFRSIQSALEPLHRLPVPVPCTYLQGLDGVALLERTGAISGNLYLLGEIRYGTGFTGYFLYASLFKVPIATQLLVLAAIGAYIARRRRFDFLRNEWFLIGLILFFALYFNVSFRT
jgi:hypothetical protein